MKKLLAIAAVILSTGMACDAAETYPSRPITIVLPAPPGGPGDMLARLLAEPMRASLGQPMIIENVGGANGTIGTARVARPRPTDTRSFSAIGTATWRRAPSIPCNTTW